MKIKELKETVRNFMHNYRILTNELIVVGGGAALHHGLRDSTEDIDVSLETRRFDNLYRKHNLSLLMLDPVGLMDSVITTKFEGLDLHRVRKLKPKMTMDLGGGYRCGVLSLEELLEFRTKLNRPKDQEEISQLKELLGITA